MFPKKIKLVFGFALIAFLSVLVINAVNRDISGEAKNVGDLRKRVVGARLIADGKSPYFYHWQPMDGIRYYDPYGFRSGTISSMTASPLFHQLMIPICFYEQKTIALFWLFAEYLMYFLIAVIAIQFAKKEGSKVLILASATAFLYTEAWKHHIYTGQLYITIPFLIAILFWLHTNVGTRFRYILMGVICTVLVLIRPNAIVFFIPLLISFRFLKLKPILQFFTPPLIAVLLILVLPFQRQLWMDYSNAIKGHTLMHQGQLTPIGVSEPNPLLEEWEGIIMKNVNKQLEVLKSTPSSENGNFFVLVDKLFHKRIGKPRLMILSISLILVLSLIFYKFLKNDQTITRCLPAVYVLGSCLYMINDLFSPVFRHQYYTVQWIFVILLFFSQVKLPKDLLFAMLIAAGLILNIINTPLIKMEHTIGEYLVLCTLLVYSLGFLKRTEFEDN